LIKPHQLIIAATSYFNPEFNLTKSIQEAYKLDSIISELLPYLENKKLKQPVEIRKKINQYTFKDNFVLYNGLIYVPNKLDIKLKLLNDNHDSVTAGHFGQAKTLELLSRNYFWPKMKAFVINYISSCDICQCCKPNHHKPYGYLKSLPIPEKLWCSISMDFIVGLPESKGYNAILVIVDRFSKMAHFIPTTNEVNASETADLFLNNIYRLHGLPSDIVSDRGTIFTSNFWTSLMKLLNVTINLSSSFHPQSDGQTERVNQILEQFLRLNCDYMQDDWVNLLPFAEFAYNNSQHSSTKMSPFFANNGVHPIALPDQININNCNSLSVSDRISDISTVHQQIIENLKQSVE